MTPDLPKDLGRFAAGPYSFSVDDGLTRVEIAAPVELDEQTLHERLAEAGAPIASWLLARLRHLAAGTLYLSEETIEVVEGGVYVIDFVVRRGERVVGKVQLQAGREGAGLLGLIAADAEDLVDRLVETLLADAQTVARCRVRVRDPDWPDGEVAQFGYENGWME